MLTSMDRLMARAQIWLASIFLLLVFSSLLIFELGGAKGLNEAEQKIFNEWAHWLKDAGMVVLLFFFQRQRGGGINDTTGTTVTQTTLDPDGTQRSITSPAHLPLPKVEPPAPVPTQPAPTPAQP